MVLYQPFQSYQLNWPARLGAVANPNSNNEFVNPFTLLQQWAEKTPEAPGLILPGVAINFSEIHAKAEALALYLADQGVGAGKRVFTQLPNDLDWLATLALMRIGAISMSLTPSEIKPEIVSQFEFGIVAKPIGGQDLGLGGKIITIGPEAMISDAEVEMVSDPYAFADDDEIRIVLVDGPKGHSSLGNLSLASIGRRVEAMEQIQTVSGFELNLSGFGSWFGLVSAIWQLRQGRPYVSLGQAGLSVLEKFAPLPIESISGSPVEVSSAAVMLSESAVAFKALQTFVMAGSALTGDFYLHIRDNLDVEMVNVLGNPISGFTFFNMPLPNHQIQDLGQLVDGVKAKITDEQNRPTVPGDVGYLSLKSPFVGLNASFAPGATAEPEYLFTGKKAVFSAGRYRLAYQEASWNDVCSDALITREIETFALGLPGVSEAAVVKAFGTLGEPVLALALNAAEEHSLEGIFTEVKRAFPEFMLSHVLRIRFIPRDVSGLPLTQELAAFVSEQLVALESQSEKD